MVDAIDLFVREVVERGRCNVARAEREQSERVRPGEMHAALACRAEEHEDRNHRSDAIAEHDDVESRQAGHLGVTTRSGQIDVSTST